jgi:small subunit ribosomal protein S16
MVKIRLMRMGAKKRPFYRVVVADARSPRDGRFIENIGRYHPLSDPSVIEIDEERALHWLGVGAQPTNSVRVLLDKAGIWEKFSSAPIEKQQAGSRTAAARASAAKAAAKVPAPEEPPPSKAPAAEEPPPAEPAPEEPAAEEPSLDQPEEAVPQEEAAADESAEGGSEEKDAGS